MRNIVIVQKNPSAENLPVAIDIRIENQEYVSVAVNPRSGSAKSCHNTINEPPGSIRMEADAGGGGNSVFGGGAGRERRAVRAILSRIITVFPGLLRLRAVMTFDDNSACGLDKGVRAPVALDHHTSGSGDNRSTGHVAFNENIATADDALSFQIAGDAQVALNGQNDRAVDTPLDARIAEPGIDCLLYTSPSPRDGLLSRMPSSA